MYNLNGIETRIKQARENAGLSRQQLADTMYVSKSTIDKWEQGKNQPKLPELLSLATILHVDINYFLTDEEGQTMILDNLNVINPEAAKTITYNGIAEIIPGWEAYYKDYDNAISNAFNNNEDTTWAEENSFRILVNLKTGELVAIRDFGMHQPTTVDFLFKTEFLPLFTHQPESAEALEARAKETVDRFYAETQEMMNRYEKPLFLVEYLGTNNYLAWSLAENKYVFVYDFKTYRENFRVSEATAKTPEEIQDNTEYNILPPSLELIKMISTFDLQLNPEIWNNKMRWDKWEPRPEMVPVELLDKRNLELYTEAVDLINKGRKTDYGCDDDFAALESRVRRFESLNVMGCPADIMTKEVELIQRAMDAINAQVEIK